MIKVMNKADRIENGLAWYSCTNVESIRKDAIDEDYYGTEVPVLIGKLKHDDLSMVVPINMFECIGSLYTFLDTHPKSNEDLFWCVSPIKVEYIRKQSDWQYYFMNLTNLVSERSSCIRRHVGAIAVKDKRIIATGYNGAPSKTKHCSETGCLREMLKIKSGERHELCRAVHAEQNLICQAAQFEVSLRGSTIFCTHMPCFICFKMLVNCGVKEIYFFNGYPDMMTIKMWLENREHMPELKYLVNATDSFSALAK